jgi:hypothetical protein
MKQKIYSLMVVGGDKALKELSLEEVYNQGASKPQPEKLAAIINECNLLKVA